MNWNLLVKWLPTLYEGFKATISVAFLSSITAILWGSFVSILRINKHVFLTPILRVYVSVFRNSPLLVQMFFFFYGLPFIGLSISPEMCGVLAITLNEGAFIAEIIRGSIKNIPVGEVEAAYSLGLTKNQVARKIIFPMAFRDALPALTGQLSIVIKDTSLLSLIMVVDLTRAGNLYYSRNFDNTSIWIVAVIYILIFLVFSSFGRVVEQRTRIRR